MATFPTAQEAANAGQVLVSDRALAVPLVVILLPPSATDTAERPARERASSRRQRLRGSWRLWHARSYKHAGGRLRTPGMEQLPQSRKRARADGHGAAPSRSRERVDYRERVGVGVWPLRTMLL